jgi:hypothetical protein
MGSSTAASAFSGLLRLTRTWEALRCLACTIDGMPCPDFGPSPLRHLALLFVSEAH